MNESVFIDQLRVEFMAHNTQKKEIFDCCDPSGIEKLEEFRKSGKDVEFLSLKIKSLLHLKEFIKTFPNVRRLEIVASDMEGELPENAKFAKLESVIFPGPVPKNIWKIFRNLKEVCFGQNTGAKLFNSEFINKIIEINKNSISKLEFTQIAVISSSYQPLMIPCQLEELSIKFGFDGFIEEICRSEKERMLGSSDHENQSEYCIKKKQITTIKNMQEVIRSQKKLKSLTLDRAVIDEDFLDDIASTGVKSLKLVDTALKFDKVSEKALEFLSSLQHVYLSLLPDEPGFRWFLKSLKNVEVLDFNHIKTFSFKSLEDKNELKKLKILRIDEHFLVKEILSSIKLTDVLEEISFTILYPDKFHEIAQSCPNLKRIYLEFSRGDILDMAIQHRFKHLEILEAKLWRFELEVVSMVLDNSEHLKKVDLYLDNNYCDEEDHQLARECLKSNFTMTVSIEKEYFEIKDEKDFHLTVLWGK